MFTNPITTFLALGAATATTASAAAVFNNNNPNGTDFRLQAHVSHPDQFPGNPVQGRQVTFIPYTSPDSEAVGVLSLSDKSSALFRPSPSSPQGGEGLQASALKPGNNGVVIFPEEAAVLGQEATPGLTWKDGKGLVYGDGEGNWIACLPEVLLPEWKEKEKDAAAAEAGDEMVILLGYTDGGMPEGHGCIDVRLTFSQV